MITQHVLRSKGIRSNFLRYCKRGTKIEFVSKYHHMSQNEFKVWCILITKPGYKENEMIDHEVRHVAVNYTSIDINISLH